MLDRVEAEPYVDHKIALRYLKGLFNILGNRVFVSKSDDRRLIASLVGVGASCWRWRERLIWLCGLTATTVSCLFKPCMKRHLEMTNCDIWGEFVQ